ncbi:MAG: transcription antitermination factor NusB [Hyphomicrobiales bacterium]|nr:MAG: transcription antitermination factor NusB [Hyphomicrobiales bacterium]
MSDPKPVIKPANKRGLARLAAVQAIYQMDLSGADLMEVVAQFEELRLGKEIDGELYREADESWFRGILAGVVKNQKDIDPLIHNALPDDWPLARMHTLLRSILRAGVFELQSRKDVPARVVINEYLDVAKSFYEEDEPKLVNGVLDRLARDIRVDEFTPKPDEAAADEATKDSDENSQ